MNLVQFRKPRIQQYRIGYFICRISWSWHGKAYISQGDGDTWQNAYQAAWRPIISEGWLRHVPREWIPENLK